MFNTSSKISSSSSNSNSNGRTKLFDKLEKKRRSNDKRILNNEALESFVIINENESENAEDQCVDEFTPLKLITCKICLNKFCDVNDNNETTNNNKNRLHQLELCKCKFCLNVSLFTHYILL